MRTLTALSLVLFALGVWALPALALEDVILNDGTVHRAEILEVNDKGIRVRFTPKSGGKVTMQVPARKLDVHFYYNLRNTAAGDDAKAHLKLAMWALDAGLFARAKAQVERAAELDPKLVKDIQDGKLPEIREGIATNVLESAKKDMADGRMENAERKIEALMARMPDTEAGAAAADMLPDLQAKMADYEKKKEADEKAQLAEDERQAVEARDKLLEPVDKDLSKGKEKMQEGLAEDSDSKALSLLKTALNKGQDALKKMDKLAKNHGDDADLMDEVSDRRNKTVAAMVRVHVHRADLYLYRGDRSKAQKELDAAKALDPESTELISLQQRIDDNQNDDALELRWQRQRRSELQGGRFGGRRGGARGGGAPRGGGGGRRR